MTRTAVAKILLSQVPFDLFTFHIFFNQLNIYWYYINPFILIYLSLTQPCLSLELNVCTLCVNSLKHYWEHDWKVHSCGYNPVYQTNLIVQPVGNCTVCTIANILIVCLGAFQLLSFVTSHKTCLHSKLNTVSAYLCVCDLYLLDNEDREFLTYRVRTFFESVGILAGSYIFTRLFDGQDLVLDLR